MEYIGIDIGGTTITGVNFCKGAIQKKEQQATGAERSRDEIISTLIDVIRQLLSPEVKAIGIGVPGILNVEKGEIISINNIKTFNGLNLKKAVEDVFHINTFINNDANCFALSEAFFGAGKEYTNIIGITLGTGVGGGIVINRKVYSGNLGAAGEFGCIPYLDGVFEDYGGSQFFVKKHQTSGKELFEKAESGDKQAIDIFMQFGNHLANLITKIMFFNAPEAIIIGGSIAKSFKYFEPAIKEMLNNFSIPIIAEHVKILPAELEDSGVMGAVALAMSEGS